MVLHAGEPAVRRPAMFVGLVDLELRSDLRRSVFAGARSPDRGTRKLST
jgi:hypothetical protein